MRQRSIWIIFTSVQLLGLLLGPLIQPGEATVAGTLTLLATVGLLLPGSLIALLVNSQVLPASVLQSPREISLINVFTGIGINLLLFAGWKLVQHRRQRIS